MEIVIAKEVHHIKPVRTHPELAYEPTNLVPMCTQCHREIDAMEYKGIDTQGYFHGKKIEEWEGGQNL